VSDNYLKVVKPRGDGGPIIHYLDDFDHPSRRKLPNFILFAKFSDDKYNCLYLSHAETLTFLRLISAGPIPNRDNGGHDFFLVEYVSCMVLATSIGSDKIVQDFSTVDTDLGLLYTQTLLFGGAWSTLSRNHYYRRRFAEWVFKDHQLVNPMGGAVAEENNNSSYRLEFFFKSLRELDDTAARQFDQYVKPKYEKPSGRYSKEIVCNWTHNLYINNKAGQGAPFCLETSRPDAIGDGSDQIYLDGAKAEAPRKVNIAGLPPARSQTKMHYYRAAYEGLLVASGIYEVSLDRLLKGVFLGGSAKESGTRRTAPHYGKTMMALSVACFTLKKELHRFWHVVLRRLRMRNTWNRLHRKFIRPIVNAIDRIYDKLPDLDDYTPNIPNLEAQVTHWYNEDPDITGYKMLPEEVLQRLDLLKSDAAEHCHAILAMMVPTLLALFL